MSSDIIISGEDPILRVDACPGAPRCAQAMSETRDLARKLAAAVPEGRSLHVSGCAKGCARARPASITIVATAAGYDVVENGVASDAPVATGLPRAELLTSLPDMLEPTDRVHL